MKSTPKRGWLTKDQQQVWRNYLLAKTRIDEYLDSALSEYGIRLDEYELLARLYEAENHTLRMGELAHSVRHSRSRLTHTITRMERRGLVYRVPSTTDGRGVLAVIADKGLKVLREATPANVDAIREIFIDPIPPEDLASLGRSMASVLSVADEAASKRKV